MSHKYNWTFSLNKKTADTSSGENAAKSYLLQLIAFLVEGGWSYDGSCNGLEIHAVNNVITVADIVVAGSGVAHTWVTLKSPEGFFAGLNGSYLGEQSRIWLTFDCIYQSASSLSFSSNYTLTKPTGGTLTSAPSAPSIISVSGNATFDNRTVITYAQATYTNVFYHFARTSKGHFWSGITGSSPNRMSFVIALFPLTNIRQLGSHDFPYATAMYQNYLSGVSFNPDTPHYSVLAYYNQNGVKHTATYIYALFPQNNNLTYRGYNADSRGIDFNGCIQTYPITLILGGGFGPIGDIADFLFIGSSALSFQTMSFDGTLCSFARWFFPVDDMLRG